jgi:hypothetical protein
VFSQDGTTGATHISPMGRSPSLPSSPPCALIASPFHLLKLSQDLPELHLVTKTLKTEREKLKMTKVMKRALNHIHGLQYPTTITSVGKIFIRFGEMFSI